VIVTIHQPEHLPWLGFVNKADQAELLVLLDNVQFEKNYYQNRNRILSRTGPVWLTVPVLSKGHLRKTIRDMEIDNVQKWRKKYYSTIYHCYHTYPHFSEYAPFFQSLCARTWSRIADLNECIIKYLFDALEVRTPIVRASDLQGQGASSDLLLDLCLKTNATTYLAGQTASNYLDEEIFRMKSIKVTQHRFRHPVYPQFKQSNFVSHLSVLDLLFNCGRDSLTIIRSGSGPYE
jgi:hypothetical protein